MKLYLVGDSTVASFNDYTYFYPRFGYGTKLQNYFNNVEVINLALSGRSSKSYLKENNYLKLKEALHEGDYLLIGFGHNDEKEDDESRFTDARGSLDDAQSFKYSLYENYIKLAFSIGAIPILCTPICRINKSNEYQGKDIHDTKTGNYKNAIIDLAKIFNLLAIDLTTPTMLDAIAGFDKAVLYHAMTSGKLINGKLTYDINSVDKTHLNEYGANVVAFYVVDAIRKSNLKLKEYIKPDIKKPDISYLHMNPEYKLPHYEVPNMEKYIPQDVTFNFDKEFYGIAFGNLGTTNLADDGYIAKRVDNDYIVGQYGPKPYGALCSTNDGICGMFKQISIRNNFILEVDATIEKTSYIEQAGFGIMLRDDLYLNQKTSKEIITSNYIVSGVLTDAKSYIVNYKRESTTEISRSSNIVHHPYCDGDKFKLVLERLGQKIIVRVLNDEFSYENEYLDFDLQAHDFNNMYVGLFSTKGTIVKYSNIKFKITGNAKEA